MELNYNSSNTSLVAEKNEILLHSNDLHANVILVHKLDVGEKRYLLNQLMKEIEFNSFAEFFIFQEHISMIMEKVPSEYIQMYKNGITPDRFARIR